MTGCNLFNVTTLDHLLNTKFSQLVDITLLYSDFPFGLSHKIIDLFFYLLLIAICFLYNNIDLCAVYFCHDHFQELLMLLFLVVP